MMGTGREPKQDSSLLWLSFVTVSNVAMKACLIRKSESNTKMNENLERGPTLKIKKNPFISL